MSPPSSPEEEVPSSPEEQEHPSSPSPAAGTPEELLAPMDSRMLACAAVLMPSLPHTAGSCRLPGAAPAGHLPLATPSAVAMVRSGTTWSGSGPPIVAKYEKDGDVLCRRSKTIHRQGC